MNKTITINILDFELGFRDSTKPYLSTYHLAEDLDGTRLTDILELHFVEMPKLRRVLTDVRSALKNPLMKWLLFLDVTENKKIREELEGVVMTDEELQKAMEELEELSRDPDNWATYISMKKTIFDAAAEETYRRRELDKALREGRAEGEIHRARTTARKLLTMGLDVPKVAEATELTLEEVEEIKQALSTN